MTARRLWRIPAWVCVCASAVPALHNAVPEVQAALPVTLLACTCAAAVLAAFGWAMRAEGTPAPPWRWSVVVGALFLHMGVGAGVGLFAPNVSPVGLVLVPIGFGGYFYVWAQRLLPPGFAPRLTVGARAFALAAALSLPLALGGAAGEVLRIPARSIGAAIFVGAVPLGAGTILWEYVRPVLGRRPTAT